MTSPVQAELERQKRAEQVKRWDNNERTILEKLAPLPRGDLAEHKAHIDLFIEWCSKTGVRHCLAKPWVVATYIAEHAHRGEAFLVDAVSAICALHNYHQQPNPAATQLVCAELDKITKPAAPRSWTTAEKQRWAELPADIRSAISRRERHRETEASRMRNENANLRRELSAQIIKTRAGPASNGA